MKFSPRPPLMQSPSTSPPPLWAVLGPVFLGLLAWAPGVLHSGFSFDDVEGVLDNPLVNGTRPMWAAFRFDYWHHLGDAGHFRPLPLISLAIDERIFGRWAPGYRITGVILHGLVLLFAGLFVRHLKPVRLAWAGLIGLCLFAMHPVLADAVAWISGRTSALSALPGVLFGWLLIRSETKPAAWAFVCVLGAALLGFLAKEDGLIPAALALLVLRRYGWRARFAGALGLCLALGIYFALRAAALGSFLPSADFAPLAHLPLDQRLAAAGGAMSQAWFHLVWPWQIAPSWSAATWPTDLASWASVSGWLPWLGALFLAPVCLKRKPLVSAALALFAVAWIPVQQWIPAGEIFAPRFLYLPLLFLSLPLGFGALSLARILTRLHGGTFMVVLGGLAVVLTLLPMAWRASAPYASLSAYSQATINRFPMDAHAWNGLGLGKEQERQPDAAKAAFKRAIEIDPDYGRPHSNLGRLELAGGQRDRARPHFEAAARLGPRNPIAWCNLGNFELSSKKTAAAIAAYERAAEIAPGMLAAWRGLARSLWTSGDPKAAQVALQKAQKIAPSDPQLKQLATRIESSL